MSDYLEKLKSRPSLFVVTLTFLIAVLGSGYFIDRGLRGFKTMDRTVTVKGLSEHQVKADLATWSLVFKISGNDLSQMQTQAEINKLKVLNFLYAQGFKENEVTEQNVTLTDRYASEYGSNISAGQDRYVLAYSINLRTTNPQAVARANNKTLKLLQDGVALTDSNPHYLFTQFNQHRLQMITEATKNAKEMALKFATDSGAHLGSIRDANQGVFTITRADGAGTGSDQDWSEDKYLNKKIRVVSTLTFNLE